MKFSVQDNGEPLNACSYEEENVICYVAPEGMSWQFEKRHQSDEKIVIGLNHLTDNAVSIPSANWVQEVNRGGLTIITDQAQDAFMSIEACIKSQVKSKQGSQNGWANKASATK